MDFLEILDFSGWPNPIQHYTVWMHLPRDRKSEKCVGDEGSDSSAENVSRIKLCFPRPGAFLVASCVVVPLWRAQVLGGAGAGGGFSGL